MLRVGTLAGGVLVMLSLAAPAGAKTFEPTRFNDPEPGACEREDCSLREAISAANDREGADVIKLSKGTYKIQRVEGSEVNFDGDFDVVGEVTIDGRGAKKTIVDGKGVSSVMDISGEEQTISDLTITGGFTDQIAAGGLSIGEGISLGSGGLVTISDVVVEKNVGTYGGIDSRALELDIERSTISKNQAMGNSFSEGGGIYLGEAAARTPQVSIRDTTISDNEAEMSGGGIFVATSGESNNLNIVNSTIAGNSTAGNGGGISSTDAVVDLYHVSIADNTADSDGNGAGDGGGVFQTGAGTFQIADSVLSANLGTGGSEDPCAGSYIGAGNVITAPGCPSFPSGPNVTTAFHSTTKPLASNGGSTQTVALLPDSEANGFANGCPKRDQRGEKRPDDCDSGAYERKPAGR